MTVHDMIAPNDNSLLLSPVTLRGVTAPNRVLISPMCQYSAGPDGKATDYHVVHLGKFAVGGAGIVMAEATSITPEGRISPWDLGIWGDEHIEPLRRVSSFIKGRGAVPAIQLAHAGRKAAGRSGSQGGAALDANDAARGFAPWPLISASALAADNWPAPRAMTRAEIAENIAQWAASTRRALAAGFEIVEIHGAHGYLIHQFLSPASNLRDDEYGGSLENRMRFALEVAGAVRAELPASSPLFFRISALDGSGGGWSIEDSVTLAAALKAVGVDVIDCSSGGMTSVTPTRAIPRTYGFQVPFSEAVRSGADVATVAVGLIVDPFQAEAILRSGKADIIGIGREALENPHWTLHAHRALDGGFDAWPEEYRVWMQRRQSAVANLSLDDVERALPSQSS